MLSDDATAADAHPAATPPRWRRLLTWELAAFLVLFVGLQFWQARDMATGAIPAFAGRLADGSAASLAGALKQAGGGPLLVYVWSSWCPVCRIEESSIKSLAGDWPVLTVAMQSGDAGEVARFMAQRAAAYPALVDEHGEIAWRLGVRGVPAWFVVDGHGLIRFSGSGYTTAAGLRLRLWWAKLVAA